MIRQISLVTLVAVGITFASCNNAEKTTAQTLSDSAEQYRPLIHFSPKTAWMNDPNGMVFYKGVYHLFYQYYPDSTVWGPMHWGHATSTNMMHWEHQPIALYPDSLGYIFSGSAVVDSANTSGFSKDRKPPLVAIFTHHEPSGEKNGSSTYQNQSLAYSLDNGKTWTKYTANPVLKNPGIKDFRDPKVSWHPEINKWVMTLATLDRISFYSSPDLKTWAKESEFGATVGAHGGVWECPDLFPMQVDGKKVWVLIVNLNPGGPNGGSATQYFVGDFDGKTFRPYQTDTRWLDYGPDEYAGVTWANTGNRRIFLGWMSNWQYGTKVPTEKWRSAMTVPRELGIQKLGEKYLVTSKPADEVAKLAKAITKLENLNAKEVYLTSKTGKLAGPAQLKISSDQLKNFSITLSNATGQKLVIGYDKTANQYFIDRTKSGKVDFEKGFAARHTAPRLSTLAGMDLTLLIDVASVELFADSGLTTMTEIFFPDTPYTNMVIESGDGFMIKDLQFTKLSSTLP